MLSEFKKIFATICAAVFILNNCAFAYDSGFSDDFFNLLNKNRKKEVTAEMTAARKELKKRDIEPTVDSFVKYVKKNDTEILQIFIDAGFDVNTDFYTDYPIYYAAKHNKFEAAQLLLKNGANPNLGFNPPLIEAVKNKNQKIVHILLEYGAKPNKDDFMSGHTCLYVALKNKQYEIAKDLLEHNARLDLPSRAIIESKNLYDVLGLDREF